MPGTTSTTSTLAVYTSPDPTTAGSVAYIYSSATLSAAPRVVISGPRLRWAEAATFEKTAAPGQWWDARLPSGVPGIYQVVVTDGSVTGSSSYEITGAPAPGPRWSAAGPALAGGLMAVDPARRGSLYVASALAGELFATTNDGGDTWDLRRTLPVAGGYPTALQVVHGLVSELIMAINGGNGSYVDDPTYTGKVLASDDGGANWRDLGLPDSFVNTVLATPDGRALVAVTSGGIEVTTDQGTIWRHIAVPWSSSAYSGAALAGADLYVATLDGLYVVHDISGVPTAPALLLAPRQSAWVVAVAADGHNVYADAFRGGLYKSADGGQTWTHVYDPPSYVSMLDDVAGRLYMTGENSILTSGDGGTDWTSWPEPVAGLDVQSVQAGVQDGTVYVSTLDGGVFTTAGQGASYKWLGGISDLNGYGVAVAAGPDGGEVVAGTESGSFRASVHGAESGDHTAWGAPFPLPVYNSATPLLATSPDRSTVYKVVDGPRIGTFTIYRSADAGASWQRLGGTNYGSPGALEVDPADPDDLYVTGISAIAGDKLLMSRDAGTTWTSVTLPGPVTALAGDPADPHRLWLGGSGGLWTSSDGGQTFTKLQSVPVNALDALSGNRLIVANSRFYVSDDGGVTLQAAQQPDLNLSATALLTVGHVLYAGTGATHEAGLLKGGHGVLRSTDGGATWQLFSNGLADRDVLSLAASPDGSRLYAGTLRGGVEVIPLG